MRRPTLRAAPGRRARYKSSGGGGCDGRRPGQADKARALSAPIRLNVDAQRYWSKAVDEQQAILHSVRKQIVSVDAIKQAYGASDDLETWIKAAGDARGRWFRFSWSVCCAACIGGGSLYKCGFLSVVQRTKECGIPDGMSAQKTRRLWNGCGPLRWPGEVVLD